MLAGYDYIPATEIFFPETSIVNLDKSQNFLMITLSLYDVIRSIFLCKDVNLSTGISFYFINHSALSVGLYGETT